MAYIGSRGWYIDELKKMGITKHQSVKLEKYKTHELANLYKASKKDHYTDELNPYIITGTLNAHDFWIDVSKGYDGARYVAGHFDSSTNQLVIDEQR